MRDGAPMYTRKGGSWPPKVQIGDEKRGSTTRAKAATIIIHSEHDDVVPIADSRELLRNSELPEDHLIVAGENHRMVDEEAFGALLKAIERAANG